MIMWFLKMSRVIMARGRKLKKVGGDLEAQKEMLFHHNKQLGSKMLFRYNQ